MLKATDTQLIASYARHRNVHKVGAEFGMRGSSAHERLVKLGVVQPINVFTKNERDRLVREYVVFRNAGRLAELAAELGRTVPFLSRQAGFLGLTDARAPKRWHGKWKYLSESGARAMLDHFKNKKLALNQYCKRFGYDDGGFSEAMRTHFPDEWEHVIESKVSTDTKYRIGRAFEYRVRDSLAALGYFVMRSPASRSPIDLVAIKPGIVLFVQCKRGGVLGPVEWNALYDLSESVGAVPILVSNPIQRKHHYVRLLARKDGSKRAQPMVDFDPSLFASPRKVSP